ncbi:MAG: hypothetical protein K6G42_07430 [Lachnospiraceae bacterium]|nr:hypothetical protein [Lachnospiraceae bacterium]
MKKGQFGYIRTMKLKSGLSAAILAAFAALIFYLGIRLFPDSRTLVGIVTVLICIPAAMVLVRFIMFMRFPPGSKEVFDIIEADRGGVPVFYDSIITTPDKSYGVNAFISADGSLLGYTEYPGVDIPKLEKHIKDIFLANQYKDLNIKVFTDREKFVDRLKALSGRYTDPGDGAEDAVLHLIGRISL